MLICVRCVPVCLNVHIYQSVRTWSAGFLYFMPIGVPSVKQKNSFVLSHHGDCETRGDRNVKYTQQMKAGKNDDSIRSLLGHFPLCFYEVIPNLYQHGRKSKFWLKITGEFIIAERRVLKISICTQTLTQLNHRRNNTNYAQWQCPASLMVVLLLNPITGPTFWNLTVSFEERLVFVFSMCDTFPKAVTRNT